jgi:hypothetical protein
MSPRKFDIIGRGYRVGVGFVTLGGECLGAEAVSGRLGVNSFVVVGSECNVAVGTAPRSTEARNFVLVIGRAVALLIS